MDYLFAENQKAGQHDRQYARTNHNDTKPEVTFHDLRLPVDRDGAYVAKRMAVTILPSATDHESDRSGYQGQPSEREAKENGRAGHRQ